MKRIVWCSAVTATLVALVGSPAFAAGPDKRGCPSSYELMTVVEVLEIATPGFEDAIEAEDTNDDDMLCVKLLPEAIPLFEPTFLYFDNNRHP
jgi:hypothetical protein